MSLLQIHVKKEYYDLIPRPLETELNALRESLREDGQLVPIVVNNNGVILDGHTRFGICQELKIDPIYETKSFENENDERKYVIITNLSRRHLSLAQRAYLVFAWWEKEIKISRKAGQIKGGKARRGVGKYAGKTNGKLQKTLGKMLGATPHTAWSLMKIFQKADEETKQRLREGEITIASAYNTVYGTPEKLRIRYPELYKTTLRNKHKICLNCGGETKSTDKEECHVHSMICCTKCRWGN